MRRPFAALVLLVVVAAGGAAPVPNFPRDPTKDLDGNALPNGATTRLGSLAFHGPGTWGVTFTADSKRLTALSFGERLIWDAEYGRLLERKSFAPNKVDDSAFVVRERIFWITSSFNEPPNVVVADLRDGKQLSRFVPKEEGNFLDGFRSIEVSPDAKYFAVVVRKQSVVAVVDAGTGEVVHSHKIAKPEGAYLYITPDSKTLYVAEEAQPLRRYSLTTGKELVKLAETEKELLQMLVSPDGKRAVTSSLFVLERSTGNSISRWMWPNKHLTVRSADTGKALGRLELGHLVSDMRFLGSDALIVSSYEYTRPSSSQRYLARWNLVTLKREWEVPCPKDDALVISPDGKCVAVAGGYSILLYDAKTGKRVNSGTGHAPVAWVGISAEGKTVTTVGEPADPGVAVWSEKGERKSHAELPELRRGWIAGQQSGDHLLWLLYGENKAEGFGWLTDMPVDEVVGWDREKSTVAWRFKPDAHPEDVFTHDGKRVVAACWNQGQKRWDAVVYDGPTGKRTGSWAIPYTPEEDKPVARHERPTLALSGDGKLLYVWSEKIAGVDVLTGRVKVRIDAGRIGHGGSIATSPDGSRIAIVRKDSGENDLQIFDVTSGKEIAKYRIEREYPHSKFSPDGKRIAVWSKRETTVTVYDIQSDAKPLVLDGGLSPPTAVAFHPNGKSAVVGYEDGTSLIWDLTSK